MTLEVEVIRKHLGQDQARVIAAENDGKSDWKGTCGYCKAELMGTAAELMAHTCEEFEASREASS